MSLASLHPHPAGFRSAFGVSEAGLGNWGIPYSGSQFSDGFARSFHLTGAAPGLFKKCFGGGSQIRVRRVATIVQSAPRYSKRGGLLAVTALNSSKSITYSTRLAQHIIVRSFGSWGPRSEE